MLYNFTDACAPVVQQVTQITTNVITSFYSQSALALAVVTTEVTFEIPMEKKKNHLTRLVLLSHHVPKKGFLSLLSFTVHSTPTGIAKGCKWSSAVNSIQSNFSSASSSSSD